MLRHIVLVRFLLAFVFSPLVVFSSAACPGAQDGDSGDGDGDGDGDAGSPIADGGDHDGDAGSPIADGGDHGGDGDAGASIADGGDHDAGVPGDGGGAAPDAGLSDGGHPLVDSGSTDSGSLSDAGTPADSGTHVDSGAPFDAGVAHDGGSLVDSGTINDGGMVADSGTPMDGGAQSDGGLTISDGGTIVLPIQGFNVINGGTFTMGCTPPQQTWLTNTPFAQACEENEFADFQGLVNHQVTLTHDFYMSVYEVTRGQFIEKMGYDPSYFVGQPCPETDNPNLPGDDCAVDGVTWDMAAEYANARSVEESLTPCYTCTGTSFDVDCEHVVDQMGAPTPYTCEGYRLPTEAEWEFAARCGADFVFPGNDQEDLVSWHYDDVTFIDHTHQVGQLAPNACGLYDMAGNVGEWVNDWYAYDYYDSFATAPAIDPVGPSDASNLVSSSFSAVRKGYRGGGFNEEPQYQRVGFRAYQRPKHTTINNGYRDSNVGFRLVRTIAP